MVPYLAVGNWKMNTTVAQAVELASAVREQVENPPPANVTVVLCPPFISLATLHALLQESPIELGAQNVYHQPYGAYTGEISTEMLKGLCRYVIIGHSERRHVLREGYHVVGQKVQAAVEAGMIPILCVGETLSQRKQGAAESVVRRQLSTGLAGVKDPRGLVIAYEPVWAIGTGVPATPVVVADITGGAIRTELSHLYGETAAERTPVLYGGSVNPDNVSGFLQEPSIQGTLVGGASLNARQFSLIVRATDSLRGVS